jgi:cytochrome oxidase assembly protein ShyY1
MGAVRHLGGHVTTPASVVSLRNAGLTAVAVALVAAMAWLGHWQFSAYDQHQNDDARAALERAPIPLDEALGADTAFPADSVSRPVIVSGRYLGAEQFYVRDMGGGGRYAVATPVLTSSGAAVIVVRGAAPAVPMDAPTGHVRVEGVLEPSQGSAAPLDHDRTTNGIEIARLVSSFDEDLYAGYVIATTSDPADSLPPVDVPRPDASFWSGIRNLLYALQWWSFAAFVVFMWWRILRDTRDGAGRGDRAGRDLDSSGDVVAATGRPDDRSA